MRAVEQLWFASLWRSDHLMSMQDSEREALETWVSLSVVATETQRIRFGPLVCPMTFRHPSIVARMAASVDQLSGGRLTLGLGVGWNEHEHQLFGLPFTERAERQERLEEGVRVVKSLLRDEPAYFSGRHYQLRGANPRPKGAQQVVPILIGGAGERTLPIVARHADE